MKTLQKITSRDNQNVKFAKRVRDGNEKGSIFIEGRRLVSEAALADIEPTHLFAATSFIEKEGFRDLMDRFSQTGAQIFELADDILNSISDTNTPQGIVLIAKRPELGFKAFSDAVLKDGRKLPLVAYLFEVNNPANLGAVARAAEAAGASGLITSPGSADAFSPKALRGSMGSIFRLPVWSDAAVDDVLSWCRESGFVTSGTSLEGSISYLDIDWRQPRMLMFGSEGHGIPSVVTQKLGELVHIPMDGDVESLNLAVSAGIILFEARRQFNLK